MRSAFVLLGLLFSSPFLRANDNEADTNKVVFVNRTHKSIKIDGFLNDLAWNEAIPVTDFIQNLPAQGSLPHQKTAVRVLYDNYAVYVAATLYEDHPDSILHELGSRDDESVNADFFYVGMDPYNTRQDAYIFGVSAAGVQVDSKYLDETFNAPWLSATQITKEGWNVEIMIPYSAIRFPKEKIQTWAFEFARKIRRTREADQWALVPSGKANPLRFWGRSKGIEQIESPVRLSFTPYVSGYYLNSKNLGEASINSFQYNFGADVKFGIDERFTLDMTLLPDFGQVQSDNKVKNLSYREVVYDENRPFFKESFDLFNKVNFMFYSRRIGKEPAGFSNVESQLNPGESILENPGQVKLLNATKISGRTNNGLGIGFFNAITNESSAIVQDQAGNKRKILTEPLTNYNTLVFDQQLKNTSNIYFVNTNVIRNNKYNDANVTASGFSFYDKGVNYSFDGRGCLSQIISKPSDISANTFQDKMGYNYFLGTRKVSGRFNYALSREVFSNTFDSRDMGLLVVNNYVNHTLQINYNQYQPSKLLQNSYNNVTFSYNQNYLNLERTGFNIDLNLFATLHSYNSFFMGGGTNPLVNKDFYEPRDGIHFYHPSQFYYLFAGVSSDYRKPFAVDAQIMESNFFSSNYNGFPDHPEYKLSSALRYRFSNQFTLSYKFTYDIDPYNPGYATNDSDKIIFGGRKLTTLINTISGKYIFTNNMFMNLNVRHYWNTGEYLDYYILQDNGNLLHTNTNYSRSYSTNFFNVDLVYNWIFSPGSMLSIVYKSEIDRDLITDQLYNSWGNNFKNPLLESSSLSLRFLYYLDYQRFLKKGV